METAVEMVSYAAPMLLATLFTYCYQVAIHPRQRVQIYIYSIYIYSNYNILTLIEELYSHSADGQHFHPCPGPQPMDVGDEPPASGSDSGEAADSSGHLGSDPPPEDPEVLPGKRIPTEMRMEQMVCRPRG